jgi:predicted nicotinamide N-methyase
MPDDAPFNPPAAHHAEASSTIEAQVLGHGLEVQTLPDCAGLRLWLLRRDVDLNAKCNELLNASRLPFWAFCWGAGQALARLLQREPERVRGKCVIDFGAGSGVAAIAAALAGAARVIAVDADPRARSMCLANAELNRVQIEVQPNLPVQWDVLLASDVLYENSNLAYLEQLARNGRTVLISDPVREGTASPRCQPFQTLHARTFPDVDHPHRDVHLYQL